MSKAFAHWLREPHSNLRGTIQQPVSKLKFAHIRPHAFPEERLFFRLEELSTTALHGALQGREVIFDLKPQEWKPELSANATNVRLLVTPPSPETRPSYTTGS